MKILLTGANGQLGREVIELGGSAVVPFSKAALDITNAQQLEAAVKQTKPHLIINAAAYTAVDKAEQDIEKAFAINRDGVRNLAQVCKHYDLPLIHVSTDYVFNGSKSSAYVEEDACAPLNIYGASKAEGERILQEEWEKHLIIRTSWVFGKYGANFVKTVLKLALKQPELRIVQDQQGCPTAAQDLAQTLIDLAGRLSQDRASWGVFHYCGEGSTTWYEFAQQIMQAGKDLFPFKAQSIHAIMSSEFPAPARRPKNSVLSTMKIEKIYGIKPQDWRISLQEVINYIHKKDELREHIST